MVVVVVVVVVKSPSRLMSSHVSPPWVKGAKPPVIWGAESSNLDSDQLHSFFPTIPARPLLSNSNLPLLLSVFSRPIVGWPLCLIIVLGADPSNQ